MPRKEYLFLWEFENTTPNPHSSYDFWLKKKTKTQPYHYSISSLIRLISLYTFSLHRSHTDAFDPLCCFSLHIFILAKSFLKRGFQNWILYIDKSQIYLFYCNASFFPFITIDWALWSFHSIKHSFLKKNNRIGAHQYVHWYNFWVLRQQLASSDGNSLIFSSNMGYLKSPP